jgi:CRISPR-associated protein Csb2
LAGVLPRYRLPGGGVAHSRHYMPTDTGKTTKVLDTFVRVDESPLLVHWPIVLTDEEQEMLHTLASSLSYLGRAESWCHAEVISDMEPDDAWCRPCVDGQPVPAGWDQITLLSAVTAETYAQFRRDELSSRGAGQPPKVAAKAALAWPEDLIACLMTDTGTLRDHGWSQPPGSRRAVYLRPSEALRPAVGSPRRPRHRSPPVEAVLLSLASDTTHGQLRPLMARVLPQMETLHDTAISLLGEAATQCPALTGRDPLTGQPLRGHGHARWIPLDLDADGRIDHVVVHAAAGLDHSAQEALSKITATWGKALPDIVVTLSGSGSLALMTRQVRTSDGRPCAELATACRWTSVTPFVSPRFRKETGKNSLVGQVQAECAALGLPVPAVEILPRGAVVDRGFLRTVRHRRPGHPQPPDTVPWALTLTFPTPVTGPISLGYASHFGLGLFAAVHESP